MATLLGAGVQLPSGSAAATLQPNDLRECVLDKCGNVGKSCAEKCGYNASCYQGCLGAELSDSACASCLK